MGNVQIKTGQKELVETTNVDCPRIKKPVTLHIQKLSLGEMEKPTLRVIHVDCEHFERHSLKCKQVKLPEEKDLKDFLLGLKLVDSLFLDGLGADLVEALGLPYLQVPTRRNQTTLDRKSDRAAR